MTEEDPREFEEHFYARVWVDDVHSLKILLVRMGEDAVEFVYQWVLVYDVDAGVGVYNSVGAANDGVCPSNKEQQHFSERDIRFL